MKAVQVAGLASVAALILSACGSDESAGEGAVDVQVSECQSAVQFLAESNEDEEYQATHTFEAADDAILACDDLASFEAAVEDHPDAVQGEPAELVSNRCEYGDEVTAAAACQ